MPPMRTHRPAEAVSRGGGRGFLEEGVVLLGFEGWLGVCAGVDSVGGPGWLTLRLSCRWPVRSR